MLRAMPVLSYIGNPKPTVFNCEFSGYPPPEVTIIKDGQVLASSKESLSYSVTVDSVDDFGEYVCTAENEVKVSSQNYTFEIISSGTVCVSLKLHFCYTSCKKINVTLRLFTFHANDDILRGYLKSCFSMSLQ